MNITLNLARAPTTRERYLLVWVMPALVVGLALLVKFIASSHADYRDYHAVHQTLERERTRQAQLRAREFALRRELDQPRYQNVLGQVRFVNSLIDQRQLSLTEVTAQLTRLLPPQARLSALAFTTSTDEPLVRLGVEAQTEEQAETFLSHLEESPDFKDVTVTQQSFLLKPDEPITVNCTAHYVGAR